MAHQIDLENFRQIKNVKEELIDILSFLTDFIDSNTEKKKEVYYNSIIRHKVDRVCYIIPNFVLSPKIFELVKSLLFSLSSSENSSFIVILENLFISTINSIP